MIQLSSHRGPLETLGPRGGDGGRKKSSKTGSGSGFRDGDADSDGDGGRAKQISAVLRS